MIFRHYLTNIEVIGLLLFISVFMIVIVIIWFLFQGGKDGDSYDPYKREKFQYYPRSINKPAQESRENNRQPQVSRTNNNNHPTHTTVYIPQTTFKPEFIHQPTTIKIGKHKKSEWEIYYENNNNTFQHILQKLSENQLDDVLNSLIKLKEEVSSYKSGGLLILDINKGEHNSLLKKIEEKIRFCQTCREILETNKSYHDEISGDCSKEIFFIIKKRYLNFYKEISLVFNQNNISMNKFSQIRELKKKIENKSHKIIIEKFRPHIKNTHILNRLKGDYLQIKTKWNTIQKLKIDLNTLDKSIILRFFNNPSQKLIKDISSAFTPTKISFSSSKIVKSDRERKTASKILKETIQKISNKIDECEFGSAMAFIHELESDLKNWEILLTEDNNWVLKYLSEICRNSVKFSSKCDSIYNTPKNSIQPALIDDLYKEIYVLHKKNLISFVIYMKIRSLRNFIYNDIKKDFIEKDIGGYYSDKNFFSCLYDYSLDYQSLKEKWDFLIENDYEMGQIDKQDMKKYLKKGIMEKIENNFNILKDKKIVKDYMGNVEVLLLNGKELRKIL